MTTLDERAQRARRAVDETVATLEPEAIDANRTRRAPLTAAALAFIAVLAVGGWYATSLGGNNVTLDTDATADEITADRGGSREQQPAYLVFDPAPEGHLPIILPEAAVDGEIDVHWTIYGREGSDRPFADGDLGIGRITLVDDAEVAADEILSGTPIDIAGTTVWQQNSEGDNVVAWRQDDGSIIGVLSNSFDEDPLLDVARSIIVDGAVDPRGLDLLIDDESFAFTTNGVGDVGDLVYDTLSQDGFGEYGQVTIRTGEPPTQSEFVIALWLALVNHTGEPSPLLVSETRNHDGQEATITRVEGLYARLVVGTGSEAVTITPLSGPLLRLNDEELLALYDTLRPATTTEVETMIEAGLRAFAQERSAIEEERPGQAIEEALDEGPEPFVRAELDDGAIWSMASDDLGQPCVRVVHPGVDTPQQFSEYCVSLGDERVTGDGSPWFISDDPRHAIALLGTGSADGIVDVEVTLENGGVEPGIVVDSETGTFWLVHLVGTARPVSLRLTDVAGGTQEHLLPLDAFSDIDYGRFTIAPFEK